jgi:hypothetical protein
MRNAATSELDEVPEDLLARLAEKIVTQTLEALAKHQRPVRVRPPLVSKSLGDSVRFSDILESEARGDHSVTVSDHSPVRRAPPINQAGSCRARRRIMAAVAPTNMTFGNHAATTAGIEPRNTVTAVSM